MEEFYFKSRKGGFWSENFDRGEEGWLIDVWVLTFQAKKNWAFGLQFWVLIHVV